MKYLVIILSTLFLIGCGGDDDKAQPAAEPPYTGITGEYYIGLKYTSGNEVVLSVNLLSNGGVETRMYYFENGNYFKGYFHKNLGLVSISGDTYTVTYSYETCDPQITESFNIKKSTNGDIVVTIDGADVVMKDTPSIDNTLKDAGMSLSVEDVDCDLIPATL